MLKNGMVNRCSQYLSGSIKKTIKKGAKMRVKDNSKMKKEGRKKMIKNKGQENRLKTEMRLVPDPRHHRFEILGRDKREG